MASNFIQIKKLGEKMFRLFCLFNLVLLEINVDRIKKTSGDCNWFFITIPKGLLRTTFCYSYNFS